MNHPHHSSRFRFGIPDSPTRHHAYEGELPVEIERAIAEESPDLWATFQEFGYSGGMDCLRVCPAWAVALGVVGIRAEVLSAGFGGVADNGGYRRIPGQQPWPHAWLAVGVGRWLFDPTWTQFRASGPPTLDRYVPSRHGE